MFRGSQKSKIDQKGRMVIPSIHRDQLLAGGRQSGKSGKAFPKLVLTGHPARYLQLMTVAAYARKERQITATPVANNRDLYARNVFIGLANYGIELDRLGRIQISQPLREHAKLAESGEVMVFGMHDHLQLWNEKSWNKLAGEAADGAFDSEWASGWQAQS